MEEYVSKKAVLDILSKKNASWDGYQKVKQLPTITAENPTGYWIDSCETESGNHYYYCSHCGKGDIHSPSVEVPYCWYCGSKMQSTPVIFKKSFEQEKNNE